MNCPVGGTENGPNSKSRIRGISHLWVRKFVRWCVIGSALFLIFLFIVGSIGGSDKGFIPYEDNIRYIASGEGVYSIIVGDKVLNTTIESDIGKPLRTSLDGKVAAFVTKSGDLIVVKDEKVINIAGSVVSYKLSVNGSSIAYSVHGGEDAGTSLYLAKTGNGKSTEICNHLGGNFAISPDGKSVAYFQSGKEKDTLMLYQSMKRISICDDEAYLYELSNNGQQIYVCIEENDKKVLYAFNAKGAMQKLGPIDGSAHFNSDHTQVLFEDEDDTSYISTKGKPALKVSPNSLDLIIVPGSRAMDNTYPVSDLYDHVYSTDDHEAHLITKDEDITLISKASHMRLDNSGEYLYYCYNFKEVRYVKISQKQDASEKATTILDEFFPFELTADREFIYYQDDSNTLMSVDARKGGTPTEISDEVDFGSGLAISGNSIVYYVVDGDLFAVSDGKKGSLVLNDVDYVSSSTNGYVYASSDDSIYITTGAKNLTKLLTLDF